jgi:hypothetical protein
MAPLRRCKGCLGLPTVKMSASSLVQDEDLDLRQELALRIPHLKSGNSAESRFASMSTGNDCLPPVATVPIKVCFDSKQQKNILVVLRSRYLLSMLPMQIQCSTLYDRAVPFLCGHAHVYMGNKSSVCNCWSLWKGHQSSHCYPLVACNLLLDQTRFSSAIWNLSQNKLSHAHDVAPNGQVHPSHPCVVHVGVM